MSTAPSFHAEHLTRRLQDAVRAHDTGTLDELVSERVLFASGRSLGRLGKEAFIAAARAIEWRSFEAHSFRSLELNAVGIVDYELRQDAMASGQSLPTDWVVTDVWHLDGRHGWRLVARHPEPTAPTRP